MISSSGVFLSVVELLGSFKVVEVCAAGWSGSTPCLAGEDAPVSTAEVHIAQSVADRVYSTVEVTQPIT